MLVCNCCNLCITSVYHNFASVFIKVSIPSCLCPVLAVRERFRVVVGHISEYRICSNFSSEQLSGKKMSFRMELQGF